ncbi:hypothetical protein QML37_29665, partial [Klebsiella pneumoniae]|uniref:hypothetical protein n=1 Tax=Klebsiella pneumoniae TaxID=573 RepID=UPI003A809C4E
MERVQTRFQKRAADLSLEPRVGTLESKVASFEQTINSAARGFEQCNDAINVGLEETNNSIEQMNAQFQELVSRITVLEGAIEALRKENQALEDRLAQEGQAGRGNGAPKLKVPEPRKYDGARDAKVFDNFMYPLETYLQVYQIQSDEMKIITALMFVTDSVMLWWHRREIDVENGLCTIDTCEEF